MVTNSQSADIGNIDAILRKKVLSQLDFLSKQRSGAIKRQNLQQIVDLERTYTWLKEYSETLGMYVPPVSEISAESHPQYAYDHWDPLFAVGESLLGELAAIWRSVKGDQGQATNAISAYHKLFELLWSRGFRGDMFPECELPEGLMPSYYIDYWRGKRSL